MKYAFQFLLLITCIISSLNLFAHGVAIVQKSGEVLELSESTVNVEINNQISIVTSTQSFRNKVGEDIVIKYGFPLNPNANAVSLRWKIDDGIWKEAIINDVVQDDSTPNTGQGGNGTISNANLNAYLGETPLFFIPSDTLLPGELITIEMVYVELLEYSLGKISFYYPGDYSKVQWNALENFKFFFNFNSERKLENYTHSFENPMIFEIGNQLILNHEAEYSRARENILIQMEVSLDDLGMFDMSTKVIDSLYPCSKRKNGYVSFLLEPQSDEEVAIIEKNFTLIVDKSGSMIGDKIDQAQDAASFIVNNLNEGDKFNIVSFSHSIDPLWPEHREIFPNTKTEALNYIRNLRASGSTNISGVLENAITQFDVVQPGKANIIIFFTDGEATVGLTDTEDILELVNLKVNEVETEIYLFTFGIGANLDKQLLTLLGSQNNGDSEFLGNDELQSRITQYFLRINNPVLLNTQMTITPANVVHDIVPSIDNLPNLYKGEQLIISGKYSIADTVNVNFTGTAFGQPISYDFTIALTDSILEENLFLPKVWAKQKLDDLELEYFSTNDQSIQDSLSLVIDDISQCYNVVSLQFNSFIDEVLPIELLSFDVSKDERSAILEWSTASEFNNSGFEILRSKDLENWEVVTFVKSQGNSQETQFYNFIDNQPLSGVSYYKLQQIDFSGEYAFSPIRAISFELANTTKLFPNPIKRGQFITVQQQFEGESIFMLFDTNGKLLLEQHLDASDNHIDLSQHESGLYFCLVLNDQGHHTEKLLIKD